MNPPRAPRKSSGGVDVQLEEFETDLRAALEVQLIMKTNVEYWKEKDYLSNEDVTNIGQVIDSCFLDLTHRYSMVPQISAILEHCRILIQNVVWAAMNVPMPVFVPQVWLLCHIERVIENALEVYTRVIYAPLRTEMIMANHHTEVLQRTWRRCVSDPSHPICRRRLEYEFRDL